MPSSHYVAPLAAPKLCWECSCPIPAGELVLLIPLSTNSSLVYCIACGSNLLAVSHAELRSRARTDGPAR